MLFPSLLVVALASFDQKACERFCERQGYDFCIRRPDSEYYYCADRRRKDGSSELEWNARWRRGAQPASAD